LNDLVYSFFLSFLTKIIHQKTHIFQFPNKKKKEIFAFFKKIEKRKEKRGQTNENISLYDHLSF
jgi:hypothetical protein